MQKKYIVRKRPTLCVTVDPEVYRRFCEETKARGLNRSAVVSAQIAKWLINLDYGAAPIIEPLRSDPERK